MRLVIVLGLNLPFHLGCQGFPKRYQVLSGLLPCGSRPSES